MHQFVPILVLITFWLVDLPPSIGKSNVFSIDLIHRDSALSPLYDQSLTSSERLRKSVLRSLAPITKINSSLKIDAKYIETTMILASSDYLMMISIGHSYEVLALASTGSDLVWVNCEPCLSYYTQDADLFNRSDSTKLPSDNELCQALRNYKEIVFSKICRYEYKYGKAGSTSGILLEDNFFLTSIVDADPYKIAFGCSEVTKMKFNRRVQGVIGLGPGKSSLVSQLDNLIESRFSYCLVPSLANTNSKIKFGYRAEILKTRISVPYKVKEFQPYYYLTLRGLSVGNATANIADYLSEIVIDSGTTMTLLHPAIYIYLTGQLEQQFDRQKVKPVLEPSNTFGLCFDTKSLEGKMIPVTEFHFEGRADIRVSLVMKQSNMFVKYGDMSCLAVASFDGPCNVLGNIAQLNFQVDYDLNNKLISFTHRECDKF